MTLGIVTAIVFLLFGMIGMGISYAVVSRQKSARREKALAMINIRDAKIHHHDAQGADKKGQGKDARLGITAREISNKLKKAAQEQKAQHDTTSLSSLLVQSGSSMSVGRFWVYSLVFGTLVTATMWPSDMSRLVVILLSFSAYFGIPRFIVRFKVRRRQQAFLGDFADALEAMIRLLKAGMPVTEAISMISREFSGPMGEEMGRVYDAQKMGVPLPDALRKMAIRVPLPEVQMFATAITIQIQTGSSLSEVLGNLSGVIRARYRLKRKVQSLSAEAKISAMIIGALPVVVALSLYAVNREYISLLFTHPTGNVLLGGAIGWMAIGVLVMKQMINFKV